MFELKRKLSKVEFSSRFGRILENPVLCGGL